MAMTGLKVLFVMAILGTSIASKILLIPGPATSHCFEMMAIGQELLSRGHNVTLLSILFDAKQCTSKVDLKFYKSHFRIISPTIDASFQRKQDEIMSRVALCFEKMDPFGTITSIVRPMVQNNCDAAFNDTRLLKQLEDEQFDIALAEGVPFTGCFIAIPLLLDIPAVAVASYIDLEEARTPLQTNVFPSIFTEYTNRMTFAQRMMTTLLSLLNPLFKLILNPSIDLSQYDKKLAKYDSRNLLKEAVLFLEDSDYIFDYPKAVFPNFVQVGGLTAHTADPLQSGLESFINASEDGIILVSFGSILKDMPLRFRNKLMSSFRELNRPIIFKSDKDEVDGKIKLLKWIPQNDILGHPKTKLFISHCGKNGFWESLYHAVPIICMAVHAETYTTKVKVNTYGIGASIDIFDDSVTDILTTVKNVLENETIYRNMKRMSTLLRDKPETPRQRAASAVEHVIKYGGDHMRPPSVDFSFLSYTCLDIWCALFGLLFVVVFINIWIMKKCCGWRSKKFKTD